MRRFSLRLLAVTMLIAVSLWGGCSHQQDFGTAPGTSGDAAGVGHEKGIPAGYYDGVDAGSAAALRTTLHAVIDDHTKIPYTSDNLDTWDVLEAADQDPNDSGRVLDVYRNASYPKYGAGNLDYNREHSWPKSYGFPDDLAANYPYTDCHHLFLSNDSYNSSRNNKPYGTAGAGTTEYPTEINDGVGGGTGVYPGWSNWADSVYWETWWDRRGDVARALFYMDVRYEGGTHGVTGYSEPDLILTDQLALIEASVTGTQESVAYMGLLSVLLQWHADDPVDAKEQARNDAVYGAQGNRNPFIDHPEWVDCLFGGACGGTGDTTPPAAPTGLTATGGAGFVGLDWDDNGEADLAGYTVYRATVAGGPYTALNGSLLGASSYSDTGAAAGVTYWYVVTASDASANESAVSNEASAAATGGGGGPAVWINEFHYDNDGTDTGEFVEIAGAAGTDLAGWSVVGYNGNGGGQYDTVALSGVIADQQGGFGTRAFAMAGMQNGSPDGLALVDGTGGVVQFLSYEGVITAIDGPASGLTSTDIGVSEPADSPVGWSLQLGGSGSTYGDFAWQAPQAATSGAVNANQTFSGGTPNTPPTAEAGGPYAGEKGAAVAFSSAGSGDPDGAIVAWSWDFGDGQTSDQASPSHVYAAAGSYTATLTVTDDQGATGQDTAPVQIVDTTAPAAPTGLAATAGDGSVALDWADNGETDLAGYTVHRATSAGGPYTALNGALLTASAYTDATASNGTTYYYVVTASDDADNVSAWSNEASATPQSSGGGGDGPVVWINEFHYDNDGADRNEFVEVAGPAGTDLTGWAVYGYNGADGAVYATVALSGALADQQGGFGVQAVAMDGMQNGSPDGLALVDGTGAVVQFLSYEGTFTAVDGPAAGLTSTDIGIYEPDTAPRRTSLQLAGTGAAYADFTWEGPLGKTDGAVNANQVFLGGGGGGDTTPPAAPTGLGAAAGDGSVALDWADNGEADLAGYTVYRATTAGGPYTALNGSLLGSSAYTDGAVVNGTTYYYVVTASDLTGNESAAGAEVAAMPQTSGGGDALHVSAIVLSESLLNARKAKGQADVTVVDANGAPVAGATVTGTFSGDVGGTFSAVTGADGVAVLVTDSSNKPPLSFGFCVDAVDLAGWTYDAGANAVTCASR